MTFDGPCFTVLSLLFLGVIEIKLYRRQPCEVFAQVRTFNDLGDKHG